MQMLFILKRASCGVEEILTLCAVLIEFTISNLSLNCICILHISKILIPLFEICLPNKISHLEYPTHIYKFKQLFWTKISGLNPGL